jgi:hypothetical protein
MRDRKWPRVEFSLWKGLIMTHDKEWMADGETGSRSGDLAGSIEGQILKRTWGRVHHLRVEENADRLTIRGSAPSYYVKQLAIQAVLDVLGPEAAPHVWVDLEVSEPAARGWPAP